MANTESQFVIMLGPPASGKSTLVKAILAHRPNLDRFIVRHQLHEERRGNTDLWQTAQVFAEKGVWIPDTVVVEMFARRLRHHESAGMLIEGLPANGAQAVMVRELLAARRVETKRILYLDAPDEVCATRVRSRRVCTSCEDGMAPAQPDPLSADRCDICKTILTRRDDDNEMAFTERLRIHRRNIEAILAAYRPEDVVLVDASQRPEAVTAAAMSALDSGVPTGRDNGT